MTGVICWEGNISLDKQNSFENTIRRYTHKFKLVHFRLHSLELIVTDPDIEKRKGVEVTASQERN